MGSTRRAAPGAELVLFPELAITGYPPEDLLLKEHFLADARAALDRIADRTNGTRARWSGSRSAPTTSTTRARCSPTGAVQAVYRKVFLPNYGVFDEQRYFQSGPGGALIELGDVVVGLTVCEDIWEPGPPASDEALAGATLLVNISASPYHVGKGAERERMLIQRARDNVAAVAFCNLVGGQDELVFDGHSLVIDHEGTVLARGKQFAEELVVATIDPAGPRGVRLRDPRQRAVNHRSPPQAPVIAHLAAERSPHDAAPAAGRPGGRTARARRRGLQRAGARPARLRRQERLRARGDRALGRDRLGAGGGDRGRRARPRAGRVVVMPSPHSSADTQADARTLAAQPRCRGARAADRRGDGRLRRHARGRVRRASTPT